MVLIRQSTTAGFRLISKYEYIRLATSFEPLNSSLLLLAPELRVHKATCNPVVLVQKFPKAARRKSVKD